MNKGIAYEEFVGMRREGMGVLCVLKEMVFMMIIV